MKPLPPATTVRLDACFPRAARYRRRDAGAPAVREPGARFQAFPHTERHLQCVWYDAALRPRALATQDGEPVEVEDPGVWNLEAGPDFLGAALRVGPERRRIAGDVEVHVHPHDWRAHAHRDDPRYARVRVHVTYFPGRLGAGELPAGAFQVSLRDALAANPAFSFDAIDVAVYPFAPRAARPPCMEILRAWSPPEREAVLDAAGQERLRRKAERFAARIADHGAEQVLYEEVFAALGYKHNKAPFRRLAELVPVEDLRALAGRDARAAHAVLLGVAGLLPASLSARWDDATRAHVRALWDAWWKHRERWSGRVMSRDEWRLAGLRPANSPVRRLTAAAWLFTQAQPPAEAWSGAKDAARAVRRASERLQQASDPYWDRRLAWGSAPMREKTALLGADRAQAIAVNVVIPFLAAAGAARVLPDELLAALPVEGSNSLVRQTAFNLFGADHPESLYRTGLRRQGLLQVFHDYCLNDRSRCASCTFPALLAAWKRDVEG